MGLMDTLLYSVIGAVVVYAIFRILRGRLRFRTLMERFEEEGILRSEHRVFTSFRFPLIKRITFTRVILTRRRFAAMHWCSLHKVLQAPLGASGVAGTETGWFEVESRGTRKLLLLRTTIRGGGRIRFHLSDPPAWLKTIQNPTPPEPHPG